MSDHVAAFRPEFVGGRPAWRRPPRRNEAVYRRRQRVVGVVIASAVTVVTLVVRAAFAGPGGDPPLALLFSPVICIPATVCSAIWLVRWSGSGSWRPASPAPAASTTQILDDAA